MRGNGRKGVDWKGRSGRERERKEGKDMEREGRGTAKPPLRNIS